MSLKRYAARRDANEAEIIAALRAAGASVQQLSVKGCPDLLVGYQGANYLMEVKTLKGKLTPDEVVWTREWEGDYWLVRTVEEALTAIGRI